MKVVVISENQAPVLFPAEACVVVAGIAEAAQHRDAALFVDLDFEGGGERVSALSALPSSLVMVNAVTMTIAEIGHPFIRVNGWPGMERPGMEGPGMEGSGIWRESMFWL